MLLIFFDKLMMFDELLGTDNRMLARKNGAALADERGGFVSSGGEAVTTNS